jgi:hypothetical protein
VGSPTHCRHDFDILKSLTKTCHFSAAKGGVTPPLALGRLITLDFLKTNSLIII